MHLRGDLYARVYADPALGLAAARLLGRDMPIRTFLNSLAVKPAVPPEGEWAPGETPWHQGLRGHPGGRHHGQLLDRPQSHDSGHGDHAVLGGFPPARDLRPAPRTLAAPGGPRVVGADDAGARRRHRALQPDVPPGAPQHHRHPPVGFLILCFPADAPYTGGYKEQTDGLGLVPGQPIDHPRFPILYDPAWSPQSGSQVRAEHSAPTR